MNEKKVQHYAIILEVCGSHSLMLLTDILVLQLYTKAYEIFKRNTPGGSTQAQSRLTLWIAYRIAQTYYDSGEFAMAVRCVYLRGHVGIPLMLSCSEDSSNALQRPIAEKNGMIYCGLSWRHGMRVLNSWGMLNSVYVCYLR